MKGGGVHTCRFCGRSFKTGQGLGGHMNGHVPERIAEIRCREEAQEQAWKQKWKRINEASGLGCASSSTSNLPIISQERQNFPIFPSTEGPTHHFARSPKLTDISCSSTNTSETRESVPQFHPQRKRRQLIPDKDLHTIDLPDLNLPATDHEQQIPDLKLPDTGD